MASEEPSGITEPPPAIPPPIDPDELSCLDERRIWIGNIDTRVTEFALLKILQKYGTLEKFDFLYHKSGPEQGKPRGYCFATYDTKEMADRAVRALNGKLALSKRIIVKSAHVDKKDIVPKTVTPHPAITTAAAPQDPVSAATKIQAIEAKLKRMEANIDDTPQMATTSSGEDPWKQKYAPNLLIQQKQPTYRKPYERPHRPHRPKQRR